MIGVNDENKVKVKDEVYELRDDEKFSIIINQYSNGKTQKKIAKEMGVPPQTFSSWKQKKIDGIRITGRNKISQYFQLKMSIWTDLFYTLDDFSKRLNTYRELKKYTYPLNEVTQEEEERLALFGKEKNIDLSDFLLKKEGHSFMFKLAMLLKNNAQIEDALAVLEQIEESEHSFKYTYYNEIQHFKVDLLSHKSIYDWDKAIHILKILESSGHYHEQEPEIITLLASNYKRKALSKTDDKSKWRNRKDIDMDLLSLAIIKYREASDLRKKEKYYDAINFAYLHSIANSIQMQYKNPKEIQNIYKEILKGWRIDRSNWWEVATNSEFLMLTGRVELAKKLIESFLNSYVIKKFEIESTLRQLEMYVHFTDSEDGKSFYAYISECWENLE